MNDPSTPPWPEGPEGEEPEISAEEAELATELTRALGERVSGAPPSAELEHLLETAELVRVSRDFELRAPREAALRAELSELWLPSEPRRSQASRGQLIRLARWLPLPIAAAGALAWGIEQYSSAPRDEAFEAQAALSTAPGARVAAALDGGPSIFPRPSPGLLRAQTELLVLSREGQASEKEARAVLDRELSQYRQLMLASLSQGEGRP